MKKTILKKINELEYHYTLLEEEVKMNYDTRNILNLIHETRSLVEKLTIPVVVKSSCAICDAENSVKEGVCEKCDYSFRDTDS